MITTYNNDIHLYETKLKQKDKDCNDKIEQLKEKHKNDLDKCEFLIPTSVFKRIHEGKINVKVLNIGLLAINSTKSSIV